MYLLSFDPMTVFYVKVKYTHNFIRRRYICDEDKMVSETK